MGVDFGDLNDDGRPDIFVSNIAATYALEESHFAFLSTGAAVVPGRDGQAGAAPYVDRSEPLGLSRSDWGWEARLADFDNDGGLEVLQATGFLRGRVNRWPELQELAMANDGVLSHAGAWPRFLDGDDLSGHPQNPFFVRSGARYVDIGAELGLAEPQVSRGIAVADVDGDGDLDYAVANQWGPSSFYTNRCPRCGAFLGLHLLLPLAREELLTRPGHPTAELRGRPAIGAQVTVHPPDGRVLSAQVDGGNGHSGKRSPEVHFGLGRVTGPVTVELAWRERCGIRRTTLALLPGWHTVRLGACDSPGVHR
jgi:hypothetical protein